MSSTEEVEHMCTYSPWYYATALYMSHQQQPDTKDIWDTVNLRGG